MQPVVDRGAQAIQLPTHSSARDRSATGNGKRLRNLVLALVFCCFLGGLAGLLTWLLSSPTSPSVKNPEKDQKPGLPEVAVNDANQTTNPIFSETAMTPQSPKRITSTESVSRMVLDKRSCQLPAHTKSKHYDLSLIWNPDRNTFDGLVNIVITVSEQTDFTVLHSRNLKITGAQLNRVLPNRSKEPAQVEQTYHYDRCQFLVVETERINPGEYWLILSFNPMIHDRIESISNAKFSAREVYPCLDEPQTKATYTITLALPDETLNEFYEDIPMTTDYAVYIIMSKVRQFSFVFN